MKKKNVVILCACLFMFAVVLTAFYFLIDSQEDEKDRVKALGTTVTDIFEFNDMDVSQVTFTNNDGKFVFERSTDTDSEWNMLSSPEEFEFNSFAVGNIVYVMSNLSSKGTVTEDADVEDYPIYGISDKNAVECVINSDDNSKTFQFYIGNLAPAKDFYYGVNPEFPNVVYKIAIVSGDVLRTTYDGLKNLYLMDVSSNEVTYMKLERPSYSEDETDQKGIIFTAVPNGSGSWDVIEPIKWEGHLAAFEEIANQAVRTKASSVVESNPENLEKYGLDEPYAYFTIKTADKTNTVSFGAYNAQTEYIYGYFQESGEVVQFYYTDVGFIWETTANVLETSIYYERTMRDVEKITIEYPAESDDTYSLYIEDTNGDGSLMNFEWEAIKNVDGTPVSEKFEVDTLSEREALYTLYVALMSVQLYDVVPDADITDSDIFFSFELKRKNAPYTKKIQYLYTPVENTFYVVIDNKYTGLTVRYSEFEGTDRLIAAWNDLNDVNFIP